MRLIIALVVLCFAYFVSSCSYGKSADLCAILKAPRSYVNDKVTVNGIVYWGVDGINISSKGCPGKPVKLVIGDKVFNQDDIQSFYKTLSKTGHVGKASVLGKFVILNRQYMPYVIYVEHIKNVRPISAQ